MVRESERDLDKLHFPAEIAKEIGLSGYNFWPAINWTSFALSIRNESTIAAPSLRAPS